MLLRFEHLLSSLSLLLMHLERLLKLEQLLLLEQIEQLMTDHSSLSLLLMQLERLLKLEQLLLLLLLLEKLEQLPLLLG